MVTLSMLTTSVIGSALPSSTSIFPASSRGSSAQHVQKSKMRASRSISVTIEDGERQEPKIAIVPTAEEDFMKSGKDLEQSVGNTS
jgi:hypothetical protein